MKKTYLLILAAVLVMAGCATAPAVKEAASTVKEEPAVVEKKEPVKVVTTVFYPVKETSFYADGTVDEVTVYTYDDKGEKLLKKEVFDSEGAIQEWEQFEYSSDMLAVKKMFDKSGDLQSYHKYGYDSSGNMISDTTFSPKDEVQSKSEFSWNSGKKVMWKVFDASGALLSNTEYVYENGLNTKILSKNPGGDMEEYFVIEYNSDGLPIKNTHYSRADKVLDARTFEYKNGVLVLEKILRANGSVKRKVVYSNDKDGNPVEIIYTDSADNVRERVVKEYKSREVISYITE